MTPLRGGRRFRPQAPHSGPQVDSCRNDKRNRNGHGHSIWRLTEMRWWWMVWGLGLVAGGAPSETCLGMLGTLTFLSSLQTSIFIDLLSPRVHALAVRWPSPDHLHRSSQCSFAQPLDPVCCARRAELKLLLPRLRHVRRNFGVQRAPVVIMMVLFEVLEPPANQGPAPPPGTPTGSDTATGPSTPSRYTTHGPYPECARTVFRVPRALDSQSRALTGSREFSLHCRL